MIEGEQEVLAAPKANINKEEADEKENINKLLELLSSEDLSTWEPIFKAGAHIKKEKADLVELRNLFITMDRAKYTLYKLENERITMRTVRFGVQIMEPYLLFLLWDDTGVATVYVPKERPDL